MVRGQILGVDGRTGEAQVAGDDGRRYIFYRDDWGHHAPPAIGQAVDFEAEGRQARAIYPLPASARAFAPSRPVTDRNKLIAALLAFFLGVLGVDRFYLGRIGSGVLILLLSCTVVGTALTIPLSLLDMIRYLVMSDEEFAARYARR